MAESPEVDAPALVAVCVGKDCRKGTEGVELKAALSAECDVRDVPCVGVCKGQVAVLFTWTEKPRVLRKLRGPKVLRELVKHLVDGEELGERLERRIVTGRKRRAAIAKAERALSK